MRRVAIGTLGALAAAVVAAACARPERIAPEPSSGGAEQDSVRRGARSSPVPLRVDNRYRADIVVFAVRGSMRARLGTVTSASSVTLAIPARYVNDPAGLVLVADPVGGRTSLQSERILVRDGQRVEWNVESSFARSSIGVYGP